MSTFHLRLRRRVPVILQAEASECALACLAMVCGYHGRGADLTTLRHRHPASLRGMTLAQLMRHASELGFAPRALRLEPAGLAQLRTPCLLHWDGDHFVVLERVGARCSIVDPAIGRRAPSRAELDRHFTGVALELEPTVALAAAAPAARLRFADLVRGVRNLGGALTRTLLLSCALQALALLAPFYGQLVIDQAIPAGDRQMLAVLGCAFALLAALSATLAAGRATVVLHLASHLQFSWAARLFGHLLRLPLTFFERRHLGDIVSRFRSLNAVQGLVSNAIVEAMLDGVMAVTTLALLLAYHPLLALVPLAAVASYAALRAALLRPQHEAAHEALALSARESSHFIETLRAMATLKASANEGLREAAWQVRVADTLRAGAHSARWGVAQQFGNQLIFGVEGVMVLWLGAVAVIDERLTLGMLVALLAYKSLFTARASALVDRLLDFRLAGVHLERLADIALAPVEESVTGDDAPLQGHLRLERVRYRHGADEPLLLEDVDLAIPAGDALAIVGPSGCGKTTLLKIMLGLLRPDGGRVLADEREVRHLGAGYRRQVAAVLQDDALLSGSLAENISFFAERPERERIEHCARLAAIHEDIMRMPMGYLTRVGDLGAALSGGQKQRVLLARALYAKPRVLFLDEATAHVDADTEKRIHAALRTLQITRVLVAHREETVALADHVLRLGPSRPAPLPGRALLQAS
ncbi:MAG TPA: peptidase domain-containing ABC transporter [Verrucomicrobiae bacterium]|nr:peptidase domain-containing ABC transporter [Verrucomicrobiae bacterium]